MLLAIDIGNTYIHNGIFEGKVLKESFRVSTNSRNLRSIYKKRFDAVIAVSVVPKALKDVEKALGKKAMVVGRDIDSGVKNMYKNPRQVGQDRLVNARAAYELYGGSCIIVDFGTAITIDVVNDRKEYLGGVIMPGVEISLEALSNKAVLLPKVKLGKPRGVLGKDTRQSMINGAVYGFSSMCDGIIARYGRKKVIATGGMSRLIAPYCKSVDKIDPELTLKGLRLIGEEADA
ncbi:MAG: type III pantothenate kinase [Candidatus Gorgyraea atricola]|nr:type III pantothenate kinase [Candidatus Gorgyraea atricola]